MNTLMRKGVLGLAGLAFAGGVVGGPIAAHNAQTVDARPVAVVQSDKSGVDSAKLIPHGTQGVQSRIDLDGEQVANVKAIIAATKKSGLDERAAVISVATSLQES
ncbi:hypothetical protein AB0L86_28765, partial [Micromonospora musae]